MGAGRRIDELYGDTYALFRFAQAALQHVAHAELAPHLLHIDHPALVSEACIAGDDEQPETARPGPEHSLDHAHASFFLLGFSLQLHEWQQWEGGFFDSCISVGRGDD